MSVVRKNKRATKGTKNWRKNIDITGLEHEIEAKRDQEKLENEVRKKLKEQPLYFIDKKPDGPAQREPLAADRFKHKYRELTATETKVISKLTSKAQRKAEERDQRNNASVNKKKATNDDEDLWADEEPITDRVIAKGQGPAVLPPHEGQSYNPSYKAHKDLLQKVVEEETIKDRKENQIVEFERQRWSDVHIPKIIKSVKERKEAREKWQRKVEKKIEHDILYVKKIKKEIEVEDQEHKKKLEERAKEQAEEDRLAAEGKIIRTKKVNRNLYYHPGSDFQLTSELKPNLRTIKVTGSLARERFDSIFRRNLVEKTGYDKKNKKKGTRYPKFKFHNTDRGKTDDDDNKFKVHK